MSTARNIAWLSASRIVSLAVLFFAYTQLFRYLGVFGSGQYQYVLSFVALFGVVVDLGVSQYVVKKMSEQPEQAKRYFHNFFIAELCLIVLVYAAMTLTGWARGVDTVVLQAICVAGLGVMLTGINMSFLSVMTTFQDLRPVAVINLVASAVNVVTIFLAIAFQKYIVFLSLNLVVGNLLALLLYYNFVKKHIGKPELLRALKDFDKKLVGKLFFSSIPFALLVGFSTVYNRADVLLITKYLGFGQTGLYTAAYKFVDLANFLPASIYHVLYPTLAALAMAREGQAELREKISRYLRFSGFLAFPSGVIGCIVAPYLIFLLAGPEFMSASLVLSVLVWAVAVLLMYVVANAFVISQATRKAAVITGVNMVVNVGLNIYLLPRYGIIAAACVTVLSELIQATGYLVIMQHRLGSLHLISLWWKQLFASIVSGLLVWRLVKILPALYGLTEARAIIYLALLLACGGLAYLGMLLLLKFFQKSDFVMLKRMIGIGS